MAEINEIKLENLLFDYTLEKKDKKCESPVLAAQMLQYIFLIREFETRVLDEYADKGLVHGPLHSSIGEEAVAIGVSAALDRFDTITSTHRGHHHFLGKAIFYHLHDNYDPRKDDIPEKLKEISAKTMAEILGLEAGYSSGRGGSMHMADKESGVLGTNAIVAGGVAIAAGAAFSEKLLKKGGVSLTYFGEGASNQGILFETMNMCALWNVPVIFLLENNGYAVATSAERSASVDPVCQKAVGAGIPAYKVDGMDPTAVRSCLEMARKHAVSGKGPVFVECDTYRYKHQAGNSDGTAFGYRTKKEVDEWKKRDPVDAYAKQLLELKVVTKKQVEKMKNAAVEIIDYACKFVDEQPKPDVSLITTGLHSSGEELHSLDYKVIEAFNETKLSRYVDCISSTLKRRMDKDETIYVIGEEVGRLGGAFAATKGLYKQYPERVIDSPISEGGFCGMALGAAITGSRPVVEIMYPDFALVAADPLFNQIAKIRHMYGNQFDVPIVVRTRAAIGYGYGAQHCLEPAGLYAFYPGWRIVAPSTPFDVIGLLNTALQSNDPVLFIEHAALYNNKAEIPVDDLDYAIPFGEAKVYEYGTDIILVSYSYMATECKKAIDELRDIGINCTLIDLRTLDYKHLDWDTLYRYLQESGQMLICELAPFHSGLGGVIADRLQRDCFDYLDGPIERLAGEDIPVPVSKEMEAASVINKERIIQKVKEICMVV